MQPQEREQQQEPVQRQEPERVQERASFLRRKRQQQQPRGRRGGATSSWDFLYRQSNIDKYIVRGFARYTHSRISAETNSFRE